MLKRRALVLLLLAVLAAWPVMGYDFHHSRTDGIQTQFSSIGQQASNQAFNLFDSLMDAASTTFALYWVGDLQENGGGTPPFGDSPPTGALRDNRVQDPEVDWADWPVVTSKTTPPARPRFTPNVPQAWSPVILDLDDVGRAPNHLLLEATFEQARDVTLPGNANFRREQILSAYYPQQNFGLPGNSDSLQADTRGTVRPLWVRNGNTDTPGLRIRDLEPLRPGAGQTEADSPNTGVVTQPLIFARVPATYRRTNPDAVIVPPIPPDDVISETLPCIYMVVGAGENNEFARVICLSLRQPTVVRAASDDPTWLPDKENPLPVTGPGSTLPAPSPNNFIAPAQGPRGAVMWSYTVRRRKLAAGDPDVPVPVAGVSFANFGDSGNSRPCLYLTTQDGQVICLNARAVDRQGITADGDGLAGQERWSFATPAQAGEVAAVKEPGFLYGMAPAVCRVPLTGMFDDPDGNVPTVAANTLAAAIGEYDVSEWICFVADTYGTFWALEAPGDALPNQAGSQKNATPQVLTGHAPLVRWRVDPPGGAHREDAPFGDGVRDRARFIHPPVVYQGNTPLRTSSGSLVNGSTDLGVDDVVVFATERGSIYSIDAAGKIHVGGADDGLPEFRAPSKVPTDTGTFTRWQWVVGSGGLDDDTAFAPFSGTGVEPRVWPRTLPNSEAALPSLPVADPVNGPLLSYNLGDALPQDSRMFVRSSLAVGLGPNTDPNGANPNLDVGDDRIFVPYMQEQGARVTQAEPDRTPPADTRIATRPPGYRWFYEYVGSLKPYGFVQASRPILKLLNVQVADGALAGVKIPFNRTRVGSVKSNGYPSTYVSNYIHGAGVSKAPRTLTDGGANPSFEVNGPVPDDTVYFTGGAWYDAARGWVTMPRISDGVFITLEYEAPTSPTDGRPQRVTETLLYPSCYRLVPNDPSNPVDINTGALTGTVVRGRASLSEQNTRLEQQALQRRRFLTPAQPNFLRDEDPALVRVVRADLADLFQVTALDPADPLSGEGIRQPAMLAAGSASSSGTLMAPSFYRGRVIALDHRLRGQRVLLGAYDPRLDPAVITRFNLPAGTRPLPPYGPGVAMGTPAHLRDAYDPGEFYDPDDAGPLETDLNDFASLTDIGGGVVLADGWLYCTYRNGHTRGYSVVSGGGPGTVGGSPPLYTPPPPATTTSGTIVRSPVPGGVSVLDASGNVRDLSTDAGVLLEYGETITVRLDFGPSANIVPPQSITRTELNGVGAGGVPVAPIDAMIFQNDIQGQIRSSNGAVQQLPGLTRGVRPRVLNGRVVADVPIFCGIPSPSNPLTPGTPLLWEREPATTNNNFDGEVTYDIQVTQPGVQWYWDTGQAVPNPNVIDPNRQHYWETERNQNIAGRTVRFNTTGGKNGAVPRWSPIDPATGQWAPLVSYNNPIILHYDPDLPDTAPDPANAGPVEGVPGLGDRIGYATGYTDRNAPGRRNGDVYAQNSVDGSRSGTGRPLVPTVGVAIAGGEARQILFGDHGKATPVATDLFPGAGKVRVGDRSYMSSVGRSLQLRVQRAPLTKMGQGARLGLVNSPRAPLLQNYYGVNGPQGSFEQNRFALDDGPGGLYPSLPESRLVVTKAGTTLDVSSSPIQVPGRWRNGSAWALPTILNGNAPAGATNLEVLGVQVDVPPFAADDLYSTRWRFTTPRGADPGDARANYNPFFPSSLFGGGRPYWDRAEKFNRGPLKLNTNPGQGPSPAPGEDTAPPFLASTAFDPTAALTETQTTQQNNYYDDRTRRAVVYVDANGNGQLDLLPNYREAYRTFGVQVMVRPEAKLEAQQALLDFGNLWHGKKQPGLGANDRDPLDMREWQRMQLSKAQVPPFNTVTDLSLARFREQYWRQFTLTNTGNVNLAFVKPEVALQIQGRPAAIPIGLASEGNDPWRLLTFINPSGSLTDPAQIFLRTSIDDQLLPDASQPYGALTRGVWLQKAPIGAATGGSVLYVDPRGAAVDGNVAFRDPSLTQPGGNFRNARESWVTLNLPTGAVLGQYSGTLRFFNDRSVTIVEPTLANPNMPAPGYYYDTPSAAAPNGVLDRSSGQGGRTLGDPLEPVSDPPLRVRARVTENMIHGRYANPADLANRDVDRRLAPAAAPDIDPQTGLVRRLMLAYVSNRRGATVPSNAPGNSVQPTVFDVFGTHLPLDTSLGRLLFPFDELPLDRAPWMPFSGFGIFGWDSMNVAPNVPPVPGFTVAKPSIARDPATGSAWLAWTERQSQVIQSAGQTEDSQIFYKPLVPQAGGGVGFPAGAALPLTPGGSAADRKMSRDGVRFVPVPDNNRVGWLALYAMGQGAKRSLGYTWTFDPSNPASWAPENSLAISKGLSTARDPSAFVSDPQLRTQALPTADPADPPFIQAERRQLPQMAWVGYSGTSQRQGRTEIYLGRYRTAALGSTGVRGVADPLGRREDYAQVAYPRVELDLLRANGGRSIYTASGADWHVRSYSQVQVYLASPALPAAANGSPARPVPLIRVGVSGPLTSGGELIFSIDNTLVANANAADRPRLQRARIVVDTAAGTVRFTLDTRTLVRTLLNLGIPDPAMPDPLVFADYTPATLRVSRGDVSAGDPVIVPVLSTQARPILDASWYLQQTDAGGKMNRGLPVAGIADRLWVFWRRSSGAVSGGPSCFYKVLRPGIRVRAGAIAGVLPNELALNGGGLTRPEEVNPQTGQLFFPFAAEGQRVQVRYVIPGTLQAVTEEHIVTWQDETGERPVPMETAVNEGSLDAFASFEVAQMTGHNQGDNLVATTKLERMWLFWSSTRGVGGDLFYATLAPRIGPDVSANGALPLSFTSAPALARLAPGLARARIQAAQAHERLHPQTLPPLARRGPLGLVRPRAGRR